MEIQYEFDRNDAEQFARHIGTNVQVKGNEMQFQYCPQCHGGKGKDKYTFAINLSTGRCNCLRASCAYKGNMITLARDFNYELNGDVARYYNINNFNGKFKKFKDAHKAIEVKDKAIEYMASRGIPEDVTRRYEITIKSGTENVLVFPFKNELGELKFIKYRNTEFKKGITEGSKEWCEANCMPILFGMYQCNIDNPKLIITEGQIDSLSVIAAGFENAVSVPTGMMGFTWIAHCWDWINQFKEIVVFGDLEKDGNITLLDTLSRRLKLRIKHVRQADYKDCKDANEILLKYGIEGVKACIDNAVFLKNKKVLDLSEVKSVNIYDMEKLKTGIVDLDKALRGGLAFGGITLLTGKAGEGKSTLGGQILLQAIEQGYKCFAYSGELPNYIFKEWLDFQAAGPGYVDTYKRDTYDVERYTVNDTVKSSLNDWYRGKCFLYDNDITASEDDEQTTLCNLIEEMVMQQEVKVILIDNLMTALDLEQTKGSDKYELQSQFMKKLTRLALTYNLCIILVAHKRKNQAQGGNENDEIAGASDIANLGMITLSYQKSKSLGDNKRLLKLTKIDCLAWSTMKAGK